MVMCEPDCDSYVASLHDLLLPAFGTSPQVNRWPSSGAACARLHNTSMPGPHQQCWCMQVLGTMLHELCHNEHGPHNAAFYKLLDEITAVRAATGRYGGRFVL